MNTPTRNTPRILLLTFPLGLPGLAFCADDVPSDRTAPVTRAAGILDQYASAICDGLAACTPLDASYDFAIALAREAGDDACHRAMTRAFRNVVPPDLDAEVAAGRVTVDEGALARCLDHIVATCEFVAPSTEPACLDFLEGTVAPGGACTQDWQCQGDAYCTFGGEACGICTARPTVGEDCGDWDAQCSQVDGEADCNFETSTCTRVAHVTAAEEGAACGALESESEVTIVTCAPPRVCHHGGDGATCRTRPAAGAPCAGEEDLCALGETCLTTGTCGVPRDRGEGAACHVELDDEPMVQCNIFRGLTCQDGTCRQWGDGSIGSVCGDEFGDACAPGNFCDDDGTCQALPPVDPTCTSL